MPSGIWPRGPKAQWRRLISRIMPRKSPPAARGGRRAQLRVLGLEDRITPSHFRGAAMVPSVSATGVVTVETTSFWRKGVTAAPSPLINVAGINRSMTLQPGSTIDTTDSRFDKRIDRNTFSLSSVGAGAGTYAITWTSNSRIAGIRNALESTWTMDSLITWGGSGTASQPIGFNFSSVQPEVVRGRNYNGNLTAVAATGLTLSYDQALNVSINSQPPGFTIDPATGALFIPAASTATYLDNLFTTTTGAGGDYAFSGNIYATNASGQTVGRVEFDWLFDAVDVGSANLAPTVDDVTASANVGAVINHTFTGSDPDADPLTWSFVGLIGPGGAAPANAPTFNATTRAFTWNTAGSIGGTWIAQVKAADPFGLTDIGSLTINLSTAPDLIAASDTGFSDTDNVTADNTPTFQGVAGAGNVVDIYAGPVQIGSITANGLGQWTFTAGTLADGSYSITAQAGATTTAALAIQIDTQPPAINFSRTAANANGWNNTDVAVTVNATDTLSGVQTVTGSTVLTSEGAGQSVSGTATDKAGNSASATLSGINIDKTQPTVAITAGPPAATHDTVASFTFTQADALSGVDRLEYALDGGAWATLSGSSFSGLAEGSHTLSVRSIDRADNVSGVATHNWIVDRATVVSVAAAGGIYGGTATLSAALAWHGDGSPLAGKSIAFTIGGTPVGTAMTDGAGVATLSGVSLSGIGAGTYVAAVGASFAGDSGYAGSDGSGDITVGKAASTASVAVSNGTYDSSPHGGTAGWLSHEADGEGAPLTLSYVGIGLTSYGPSATAPTNAGEYQAVAVFPGDVNHTGSSDTQTFTIGKAASTTNVTGDNFIYDGTAHAGGSAVVTGAGVIDSDAAVLSYTGDQVNAGTYTVTAYYAGDANHEPSDGAAVITIHKATATVTVAGYSGVYDGLPHGATGSATGVNGEPLAGLDLGASFANVPGGTAHWAFTDVTGNYNDDAGSVNIVITKADAHVSVAGYTGVYDGHSHGATGSATGVNGETLAGLDLGAGFANVPGGTADWAFADVTGNYNDASGSVAVVIAKADAAITVSPYAVTYDGAAHTAAGTATGVGGADLSAGLNLSGTTHTNAGTYTDGWTFAGGTNYNDAGGTVNNAIAKAASVTTTLGAGPFTYDGLSHAGGSGTVTGAGGLSVAATSLTYSGDQINAGIYYVTAHYAGDANHEPSDGAAVAITINKAASTTAVVAAGGVYNGSAYAATGSVTGAGSLTATPTFLYVGTGATNYPASSVAPKNAGTYSVTATYAGDANHFGSSATVGFTIGLATLTGSATAQDAWNLAKQGKLNITVSNISGLAAGDTLGSFLTTAHYFITIGTARYEFVPTTVTTSGSSISISYTLNNAALVPQLAAALTGAVSGNTAVTAGFSMESSNYVFTDDYLTRLFSTL